MSTKFFDNIFFLESSETYAKKIFIKIGAIKKDSKKKYFSAEKKKFRNKNVMKKNVHFFLPWGKNKTSGSWEA